MTCDERCHVAVRATAFGRTAALRSRIVLAAGSHVVLRMTIRRATRAAIARRRSAGRAVTLRIRVTAADDAGNATTRRLAIRIVASR